MPSPEMEAVINSISEFPEDLPGQRKNYADIWATVPVDTDIEYEPLDLGGSGARDSERVWVPGADQSKVFFYYHGGGYVCGEPWMWRQFNGTMSRASGFVGISYGYRLAPEYPFPTAVEDCVAGYLWLVKSGISPDRIVLTGDSAGGGLVLSVLMTLRDRGHPMPAGGVALSPWTDLELKGETVTLDTGDPITKEEVALKMARTYMNGEDAKHPLASQIYADLHDLPPLHIESGERDILYSDSTRVVARLQEHGSNVAFYSTPGAIHSFPALAGNTPEAAKAMERIAKFMNKVIK